MTVDELDELDELDVLTPREVAAVFRVHPRTVTRWAREGLIPAVFTPGGQRRYLRRDVVRLATARHVDADPVEGAS